MPHEELREKNIRLVIENALDSFLENGIEKTKVADVARRSGLTERSVFRYFETKADLVLAASLLYWNRILALIDRMSHENSDGGTTGLEDAANVLVCYSMLYHLDPEVDVKEIYYNSYDAILGIMQRLSIGGSPSARELDYDSRMLHLSEMFVKALSGK